MDGLVIALFLGIALIDSINPSALVVTGYLLQRSTESAKTRGVISYGAGIFSFYFFVGLLLLLGLMVIADNLKSALESRPAYIIQAIIGVALFVWSWIPPKPREQSRFHPTSFKPLVLFGLGITVTFFEFITALPYLGAIPLLQQTALPIVGKIGLLLLYNLIFILPPIAMLIFYNVNKKRFAAWQARRAAKRGGKPDDTLQWIMGALGILFFLNALSHLGGNSINFTIG